MMKNVLRESSWIPICGRSNTPFHSFVQNKFIGVTPNTKPLLQLVELTEYFGEVVEQRRNGIRISEKEREKDNEIVTAISCNRPQNRNSPFFLPHVTSLRGAFLVIVSTKQDKHTAHHWPADVQTEYPSKKDSTTPHNLFQMASINSHDHYQETTADSQVNYDSNNTFGSGLSMPLHDNLTGSWIFISNSLDLPSQFCFKSQRAFRLKLCLWFCHFWGQENCARCRSWILFIWGYPRMMHCGNPFVLLGELTKVQNQFSAVLTIRL